MGENFELPANFPQSKNVIDEQLQTLKTLNKNMSDINLKVDQPTSSMSNTKSGSSKESSSIYKKREKTTSFVPNTKPLNASGSNMSERLENAAPYNIFFTKVPDAPQTVSAANSISFPGKFL